MGMVKETMMLYCETVHPDDWEKQDELFLQIMETGEPSLEEMCRAVEEFRKSGQVPSQPAMTLRRVTAALEVGNDTGKGDSPGEVQGIPEGHEETQGGSGP